MGAGAMGGHGRAISRWPRAVECRRRGGPVCEKKKKKNRETSSCCWGVEGARLSTFFVESTPLFFFFSFAIDNIFKKTQLKLAMRKLSLATASLTSTLTVNLTVKSTSLTFILSLAPNPDVARADLQTGTPTPTPRLRTAGDDAKMDAIVASGLLRQVRGGGGGGGRQRRQRRGDEGGGRRQLPPTPPHHLCPHARATPPLRPVGRDTCHMSRVSPIMGPWPGAP